MKTWHYIGILTVCVWCLAGPVIGFYKGKAYLPTIQEIQTKIGCEKIDGKLCAGWAVPGHSETAEKWDDALCEKHWLKLADSLEAVK